jgi:glycosyltransferase involved in cell wall biosynthesis
LQALYSGAHAMLFPSLDEGFGWPILEAQACGCPVITSDQAPMTEIAGEGAILIDARNPVSAAASIAEGLRDRDRWIEAGSRNLARFATDAVVSRYCEAYEHILNRPRSLPGR